ncbi:HEAT repeat-containing protein 3-like isoform X1 [Watersipora subatra]|uniref:HEAT repeat-containing protein 3-like isoform X1 n=1 Tax=Watersipora subatra TaxID=2589382 RepID=UPI00355C218C
MHINGQNNPTGLPSVKEMAKEISDNDRQGMETVIEQLSSADADEREYGCTALGMYVSNPITLQELLKKDVVRRVTPLLQDSKPSVQWAASIVIRGISDEGGFDACETMIKQDVITGVAAYLRNPSSSEEKGDRHVHGFVNCIYTIQNLCECSALAVRLALEDSIPQVLVSTMHACTHPAVVLLAAAQCLYTMSEENETVAELLKLSDTQNMLLSLIEKESVCLYTRVVLVGVQLNTYGQEMLNVPGNKMLAVLIAALQVDTYSEMCEKVSMCRGAEVNDKISQDNVEMEDGEVANTKKGFTENDLRKSLDILDNLISAQKLSFEILTNMLGGEDPDGWADMDDDTSSCGTAPDATEYMQDEEEEEAISPVVKTLSDAGLTNLLMDRLKFVEMDVYESVEKSDKLHRQPLKSSVQGYDSMLTSALLCLNNIVSQVKMEHFGGSESLQSSVKLLLASLSLPQVSSQELLVESIVSAARSIIEQLSQHSQSVKLDDRELESLQRLTSVPHTATAVHAVRCLAFVGMAHAKQIDHPLTKAVGTTLLSIATTSKELWLVTESLDAIMDVFSDDTNNNLLAELEILSTLSHILPQLKSMVAKGDKIEEHFKPVLATVRSNLPRFIKYKTQVMQTH